MKITKFRKKPVVIEAVRWSGNNLREVINFTGLHPSANKWSWEEYEQVVAREGLKIFTLEGPLIATEGDWIIRGLRGEYYPCKCDIFEATYDPADATSEITRLKAECQKWQEWHDCEYRERKKYRWDEPEWEEVEVKADPQSPNSVWYRDECGVTRQVPRDAEIIAVFRRRKPEPEPEPEPEVWVTEVVSRYGLVHLEKEIPREWIGKRVRVEVIEP